MVRLDAHFGNDGNHEWNGKKEQRKDMTGTIIGTGACAASHVMENDDLAQLVDTSDAWITERTGIKRRHIAENETVSSLAIEAAKRALLNAGISADEIGLIIVSTMTPESIMPCTASLVQAAIHAAHAICFDLNAACSGFVSAFVTARTYLLSGIIRYALVIGSEVLSNVVDWTDRGSCILFGDGAGAVVLGPVANGAETSNQTADDRGDLVDTPIDHLWFPVLHADGNQAQALTLKSRHDANGLFEKPHPDWRQHDYFIGMDGRAVFQFAIRKVPEVIGELLEKNNLKKEDITFYVLHQANRRIVEAVAKRMGEPIEKFPMNLDEYGNTSSASIPILLDEMNQKRRFHAGDRIVLAGFGGGLTWGADVITWTKP